MMRMRMMMMMMMMMILHYTCISEPIMTIQLRWTHITGGRNVTHGLQQKVYADIRGVR